MENFIFCPVSSLSLLSITQKIFNPFILVVIKGQTYLNKPEVKAASFFKYAGPYVTTRIKGLMKNSGPRNSFLLLTCVYNYAIHHFHRELSLLFRSSRPDMFCKKGVLENFTKFTGKHLCQVSFLTKLQASGV